MDKTRRCARSEAGRPWKRTSTSKVETRIHNIAVGVIVVILVVIVGRNIVAHHWARIRHQSMNITYNARPPGYGERVATEFEVSAV